MAMNHSDLTSPFLTKGREYFEQKQGIFPSFDRRKGAQNIRRAKGGLECRKSFTAVPS